jgi:hypothetical protein
MLRAPNEYYKSGVKPPHSKRHVLARQNSEWQDAGWFVAQIDKFAI